MAITSIDQLVNALGNSRQKLPYVKASITNQLAGGTSSYWRVGGFPGAGVLPSAPATCNNATLGGIPFNNPGAGGLTYFGRVSFSATSAGSAELHDRMAHMGGLLGNVTTAQTVGIDLNALGGTDNIAQRKGRSDYGSAQWWFEWYTLTGNTATVATVTYTDQNGTANKTTTVAITGSMQPGRMLQILPVAGDYIRSIESIQLSVTTGTAGSFGVTVTCQRTELVCVLANMLTIHTYDMLGMPPAYDSSCLFFMSNNTGTTSPGLNGATTLVQG
jgi:hypothetical protein